MIDGVVVARQLLGEAVARRSVSLAAHLPSTSKELLVFLTHDLPAELGARTASTLLAELLADVAVWFSPDVCARLPVLVPHVRRDGSCRKEICGLHVKRTKGRIGEPSDRWAMPDAEGYVRDDNSLIKFLVNKTLKIRSSVAALDGRVLKTNYVACHIRRMADATDPWLNSFVPNLVWLPKPLDVMSDRPGGVVQQMLRAMSHALYSPLRPLGAADELFDELPDAVAYEPARSFFVVPEAWLARRGQKVSVMSEVLAGASKGLAPLRASGHTHYDQHLAEVDARALLPLAERLTAYARIVGGPLPTRAGPSPGGLTKRTRRR